MMSDPQENSLHANENVSDDAAQGSTTTSAAPVQSSTIITGMDQYTENQASVEILDAEQDEAAERELDRYITTDTPQASQESLDKGSEERKDGIGNEADREDSESEGEVEVEEIMKGVTPSHEGELNGGQVKEPLSPALKRKQRMDEILQHEDGESELEDEQMTDADQEDQESASAPIPEGLCVECRDQVIRIQFNFIVFVY
jgi:hypothetical protein